ncbi:MAG TPA: type II toxin-antitoxin system VapC family toxin [Verrucomicrobiae bacterium]|nr:type II toxin-antitoxin system VapC family toxin [Verrucomicrobiae bacterium]
MSYWDTSALGKLYVPEPDSVNFEQKAAGTAAIVTTRFALYEMSRIAFRKEVEGSIPVRSAESIASHLQQDLAAGQIRIIDIDSRIEAEFNTVMAACYRNARPLLVRTFDAIHLASARVSAETEVVATDSRLREAAKLLGLSVFPPDL